MDKECNLCLRAFVMSPLSTLLQRFMSSVRGRIVVTEVIVGIIVNAFVEQPAAMWITLGLILLLMLMFLLPRIISSWRKERQLPTEQERAEHDLLDHRRPIYNLLIEALEALELSYDAIQETVSYIPDSSSPAKARALARQTHEQLELIVRKLRDELTLDSMKMYWYGGKMV